MFKKLVLVLLDGLGDKGIEEFRGQTPLMAANTPAMDAMARNGACGLYHPGTLGRPYPSENAHFSMFNYGLDEFPGRGLIEALGAGVEFERDEALILGRLECAAVGEDDIRLSLERPGYARREVETLARAVGEFRCGKTRISFEHYDGLHGIVRVSPGSRYVTDSNPMNRGWSLMRPGPWKEHENDPATLDTAEALNAYLLHCLEVLGKHPVNRARSARGVAPINALVTQRAGAWLDVPDFLSRNGMRAASVSSGFLYPGIGRFLGMDVHCPADEPKGLDPAAAAKVMAGRLQLAGKLLSDYDFIHLHVKYPDEAAHAKDPVLKMEIIQALDSAMVREGAWLLSDPEVVVCLTSDHSTPSAGPMIHSGEPVPVAFRGVGVRRDMVQGFDESQCAMGCLGLVRGRELMHLALNFADRAKLVGAMDTGSDQAYWPGAFDPLCPPVKGK